MDMSYLMVKLERLTLEKLRTYKLARGCENLSSR